MGRKKSTEKAADIAPKRVTAFTQAELAGTLSYFAGLLDETVDAVFLAAADEGFLTPERSAELLETQNAARIIAEAAAFQAEGSVMT
jgi:hypothetical protein